MNQIERDSVRSAAISGRHRATWLCAFALSGLFACSSSDDKHDNGTGGAGGGSAGASGQAGGGTGGTSGAAGSVVTPVTCGSNQCTTPPNPLSSLLPGVTLPTMTLACCVDEASGTCGTQPMAGATCEPPAVSDARCPGIDLGALAGVTAMFGVGTMSGCCVDNMCGLDGMILGRGCVENSQAQSALGAIPVIGALISVPPPLACDRPLDTDGGTEDAGL